LLWRTYNRASSGKSPPETGAEIILKSFELGVNFIDTAELYGTYSHIGKALKKTNKNIVVATKSYAYSAEGAKESLEKARKEMDIDVIDIFYASRTGKQAYLKRTQRGFWNIIFP